jgi:hypothetical protein
MENKYIYEVIEFEQGFKVIKRTSKEGDEAWVPTDPANNDYKEYLAWAAEVNEESTSE